MGCLGIGAIAVQLGRACDGYDYHVCSSRPGSPPPEDWAVQSSADFVTIPLELNSFLSRVSPNHAKLRRTRRRVYVPAVTHARTSSCRAYLFTPSRLRVFACD